MIPPTQHLDGARLVPVDPHAEESLAALAVTDAGIAVRLVDELMPVDFHDPRCWTVIEAGAQTPPMVDGDTDWEEAETLGHGLVVHGCAARALAIADATGLEWSWLAEIVGNRSSVSTNRLMERVVEVGTTRQENAAHIEALREADVDVRWITECDVIVAEARYAVLYVAETVHAALHGNGSDADVAHAFGKLGSHFGMSRADLIAVLAPGGDAG
jgi:hypothetical protein